MGELLVRYKLLPIPQRVIITIAVFAMLLWFFSIKDKLDTPKYQLEEAQSSLEIKQNELDKMMSAVDNADSREELEKKKTRLTDQIQLQLGAKSRSLPQKFHLDGVIDQISQLAKTHSVKLLSLEIGEERELGSEYRYYELPIQLEIQGTYSACGYFYGDLIQLETLVHMRDIKLDHQAGQRDEVRTDSSSDSAMTTKNIMTNLQAAFELYLVKSVATMVIFKSS